MEKPLVSIVLILFNNEFSIIETMKSISMQTYKNIELIIFNDGCTDNTINMLKKYMKSNHNIKLFNTAAIGTFKAQKTALNKAKGKYVIFFEPGILMNNNLIEHLVSNIESNPSEIITCDFFSEPISTLFTRKDITKKSPQEKIIKINNSKYMQNLYSKNEHTFENCTVMWNKLINRKWLLSTRYIKSTIPLSISYDMIIEKSNILKTNQILICKILYDNFYETNCFKYEHLDTINFIESLLIKYKKENNENAMYNTSIRLLKFLLRVRKQLSFFDLELKDKLELRKNIDLKFNSIYKFLVTKFKNLNLEYEQYNAEYRNLIKFEKFRAKYFYLYPEYTQDYSSELYYDSSSYTYIADDPNITELFLS